jgi:hypothetical protein
MCSLITTLCLLITTAPHNGKDSPKELFGVAGWAWE